MIVLGLTGSIGMGKTATAGIFRGERIPVYDADAAVHELYAKDGAAIAPIEAAFPGVTKNGAIDRAALRELVVGDLAAMKKLEAIVHPLAGQAQLEFKAQAESDKAAFIVLDIPLLYESGGWKACDYVAVVTAPSEIQKERVLAREGMTEKAFEAILKRQMPDIEKCARADFVISTAFGFDYVHAHVKAIKELMLRLAEEGKA